MESILNTVKAYIGPMGDDTSFDAELIMHINSALATLTQLGVGPKTGYCITGERETWVAFMGNDEPLLNFVPEYVGIKVKLVFDPPQNQSVREALERSLAESTWRIATQCGVTNS